LELDIGSHLFNVVKGSLLFGIDDLTYDVNAIVRDSSKASIHCAREIEMMKQRLKLLSL
jgi:hypothetical protein